MRAYRSNESSLFAGADDGAGGAAPSGAPNIEPVEGTLGRRSRGGGAGFVGVVWKGNPDAVGAAPSGVPKSEPVGGTLGKRSRCGGGALLVDGVWKGNPNALSGVGIDGRGGDDGGGTSALGGALGCARGTETVNADAGGTLGKRSRCGASLCVSGVWKGNADELLSAARRWRADVGSSSACVVARNGSAGSVEACVSGMSVFPILTPALDGTRAAFESGKGDSVVAALAGFGAG